MILSLRSNKVKLVNTSLILHMAQLDQQILVFKLEKGIIEKQISQIKTKSKNFYKQPHH